MIWKNEKSILYLITNKINVYEQKARSIRSNEKVMGGI